MPDYWQTPEPWSIMQRTLTDIGDNFNMQKRYGWIFIILLTLLFCGCLISQIASMGDSAKTWIGEPIFTRQKFVNDSDSYALRIAWKETTYPLKNGNFIYVEPVREDCFIRWEVNPDNIIVDYKTERNRCF